MENKDEVLTKIYWLVCNYENKSRAELLEIIDKIQYFVWSGLKTKEEE